VEILWYEHHGRKVAVLEAYKGKHRDMCLCFQGCVNFKPEFTTNCKIAQANFENCVKYGTVQPVVECPEYRRE
jgi:hypothetical protein